MPRISPLPKEDAVIGNRLREARQKLLIPRTSMAVKIGISTDRLIHYEFGRVRLPWATGSSICTIFRINPFWLFDGNGPTWFGGSVDFERFKIPDNATFATAISLMSKEAPEIRSFIEGVSADNPASPPQGHYLNDLQSSIAAEIGWTHMPHWLDQIDPNDARAFAQQLVKAGNELVLLFVRKSRRRRR